MRTQRLLRSCFLSILLGLIAVVSYAQFNASIQGSVTDPSGAVVPKASITLTNVGTQVTATTTSDNDGNFRFISLAPGNYQLSSDAPGFAKSVVNVSLETNQNLNVPVHMNVAASSQAVQVTGEAPLLNTAETRNQLTLETTTLSELPLPGRNM